jgi:hypothetical protein
VSANWLSISSARLATASTFALTLPAATPAASADPLALDAAEARQWATLTTVWAS